MPPRIQRTCGACDRVDDGPRNQVDLGDGRAVYFHLPGSKECGAPGADPRPDLDESADISQFREAARAAGYSIPDDYVPQIASVDASDPANHNAPAEKE